LAGIAVVVQAVNAANKSKLGRKALEKTLGVHRDAPVPQYHSKTARKRLDVLRYEKGERAEPTAKTSGKVVLFSTCYGNRNMPALAEDLVAVYEHNDIPVAIVEKEVCCGMPKLELGDLEAVRKAKEINIPDLVYWVDMGWDIVTPIPSCTLMFKQELPLMFPDDADVIKVRDAMFDPFEYLMLRHKDGKLKTDFKKALGKMAYQVPCHLRVQNIGLKTRDLLAMVPDTEIETIERCSGHDGTYALKKEFHEISKKIARPVISKVKKADVDHFFSDCPMAAEQIAQGLENQDAEHPLGLLRTAYGI
jgi:Fe-S oxidoreductase